jgi:hypothetical protein
MAITGSVALGGHNGSCRDGWGVAGRSSALDIECLDRVYLNAYVPIETWALAIAGRLSCSRSQAPSLKTVNGKVIMKKSKTVIISGIATAALTAAAITGLAGTSSANPATRSAPAYSVSAIIKAISAPTVGPPTTDSVPVIMKAIEVHYAPGPVAR